MTPALLAPHTIDDRLSPPADDTPNGYRILPLPHAKALLEAHVHAYDPAAHPGAFLETVAEAKRQGLEHSLFYLLDDYATWSASGDPNERGLNYLRKRHTIKTGERRVNETIRLRYWGIPRRAGDPLDAQTHREIAASNCHDGVHLYSGAHGLLLHGARLELIGEDVPGREIDKSALERAVSAGKTSNGTGRETAMDAAAATGRAAIYAGSTSPYIDLYLPSTVAGRRSATLYLVPIEPHAH